MRKIKVTFFERFGEYAHKCKEYLLIKCKSPKQRWIVLIFSLNIIPLVSGMLIQNDVGQFFMFLGFYLLLVFCSLGLCYCQVAQRGLYRNIIFIVGLNESEEALIEYRKKIKSEELKNNLSRTEHLRWMAYMLLDGCELWHAPLKTAEVSKANQSTKFYRHATLVEYEKLSKIDKIFPAKKTFREKDLEIIENLPLFYEEFWAINE